MTPKQLVEARKILGFTQQGLQQELGLNPNDGRTVRNWESGRIPIPKPCEKLIKILVVLKK